MVKIRPQSIIIVCASCAVTAKTLEELASQFPNDKIGMSASRDARLLRDFIEKVKYATSLVVES